MKKWSAIRLLAAILGGEDQTPHQSLGVVFRSESTDRLTFYSTAHLSTTINDTHLASVRLILRMNASKQTRCLFCKVIPSTPKPSAQAPTRRRNFHTTPTPQAQRKPAYPNVKAVDMGLVNQHIEDGVRTFKPYTAREKQLLALKYTPAQLRAIEAAETAIDPKDIVVQGKLRADPFSLDYIDDMSKIAPVVDKPVRALDADIDPDIRTRSQDEILDRFAAWTEDIARKQRDYAANDYPKTDDQMAAELSSRALEAGIYPGDGLTPAQRRQRLEIYATALEGPDAHAEWDKFISNANNFFYSPKGTLFSQSDSLAPTLPKLKDPEMRFENEDEDPNQLRLLQQTGLSKGDIRRIRIKNLVSHRVVNQTRLGKISSMYYLTIAGNENGMLGVGEGKAAEEEDGRRQAMMSAIRNMKPIPRYEGRTIFGEIESKVGASVVQLSSRPPGEPIHPLGPSIIIPTFLSSISFRISPSPTTTTLTRTTLHRLRKQMPTPHLRNGPRRRHKRPLRPLHPLQEPHERRQSHLGSPPQPAFTRRRGARTWKEDG